MTRTDGALMSRSWKASGPVEFVYGVGHVADLTFGQLLMVRQGSQINVKYDPDNMKHVVILQPDSQSVNVTGFGYPTSTVIHMANGQPSGSTIAHQVIELAVLHQRGELSDAEFEAAKKKLFS